MNSNQQNCCSLVLNAKGKQLWFNAGKKCWNNIEGFGLSERSAEVFGLESSSPCHPIHEAWIWIEIPTGCSLSRRARIQSLFTVKRLVSWLVSRSTRVEGQEGWRAGVISCRTSRRYTTCCGKARQFPLFPVLSKGLAGARKLRQNKSLCGDFHCLVCHTARTTRILISCVWSSVKACLYIGPPFAPIIQDPANDQSSHLVSGSGPKPHTEPWETLVLPLPWLACSPPFRY